LTARQSMDRTPHPPSTSSVQGGGTTSAKAEHRRGPETGNEQPVRRFADAINESDLDSALSVCDPEIEFRSMLGISGRAYIGHQGIREYFEDVASAWEEWRVEVHRVAGAPDGRVVIAMTMHVRGRESGAALSEHAAHVWTVEDGKLLRNELYHDPDEALRAVGVSV
jgi:ketosteroid isomerase-like protein